MSERPEIPMSRLLSLKFGDTDPTEHVQRYTRADVERIICETIYRHDPPAIGYHRIAGDVPDYDDIITTALTDENWMVTP